MWEKYPPSPPIAKKGALKKEYVLRKFHKIISVTSEIISHLCLPNKAFETAEFWCIVGLTAILRLLERKNSTFP